MINNNEIHTDDKLMCIQGNTFYSKGQIYTVGRIVNDKYFQILTSGDDDHWYATLDDKGICVSFDSMIATDNKAFFDKIAQIGVYIKTHLEQIK